MNIRLKYSLILRLCVVLSLLLNKLNIFLTFQELFDYINYTKVMLIIIIIIKLYFGLFLIVYYPY